MQTPMNAMMADKAAVTMPSPILTLAAPASGQNRLDCTYRRLADTNAVRWSFMALPQICNTSRMKPLSTCTTVGTPRARITNNPGFEVPPAPLALLAT